jgi:hypothetical protein
MDATERNFTVSAGSYPEYRNQFGDMIISSHLRCASIENAIYQRARKLVASAASVADRIE